MRSETITKTKANTQKDYTFEDFIQHERETDPAFGKAWDDDADERALGLALLKARTDANMSQRDLMEKTGINQGQICRIECAEANPSFKTLKRLAAGMGMKIKVSFEPV